MSNITINGINITESQIQQLLTTRDKEQELISLLSMLFTNMNNLDRLYYDMFINSTPMDLVLERYDDQGVLQTYIIPNRAKDKGDVILGVGDPEGVAVADSGRLYLNTITGNIFYKREGNDAFGWTEFRSKYNMVDDAYPSSVGKDVYLRPNGSGSNLQNLNANNITGGTLTVYCGGTGQGWGATDTPPYTDGKLLKYNNSVAKIVSATEDVDYLVPGSFTGQIAYFLSDSAPSGWLVADGSTASQSLYSRLYNKIGTRFNNGTEPAGEFRLPDLRGYFIRCWDKGRNLDSSRTNMSFQNPAVPQHTHDFWGTTNSAGGHNHNRGDMNITGSIWGTYAEAECLYSCAGSGAIFPSGYGVGQSSSTHIAGQGQGIGFDASRNWTGNTSWGGDHSHTYSGTTGNASNGNIYRSDTWEVRPYNFAALACIKF